MSQNVYSALSPPTSDDHPPCFSGYVSYVHRNTVPDSTTVEEDVAGSDLRLLAVAREKAMWCWVPRAGLGVPLGGPSALFPPTSDDHPPCFSGYVSYVDRSTVPDSTTVEEDVAGSIQPRASSNIRTAGPYCVARLIGGASPSVGIAGLYLESKCVFVWWRHSRLARASVGTLCPWR